MRRVCVFCGSSFGKSPKFKEAAVILGRALAGRRLELVYGGGNVGLMGVVADAVLEAGGHVIGVIPEALAAKEVAHRQLPDLRIVGSMHERKAIMADLSDGFIALPGGMGTLEELCEILTWSQLGMHDKPCGVLNIDGYYDRFLDFLDHAVGEQLLKQKHRDLVLVHTEADGLLDLFSHFRKPKVEKWINRGQS
ncbi:MAG: TIGR00730 family Rossman fold protein [Planctomycetota bacterium]